MSVAQENTSSHGQARPRSLGCQLGGRSSRFGCLLLGVVVVAVIASACGGESEPVSPSLRPGAPRGSVR